MSGPHVVDVTAANFEAEVIIRSQTTPVVLDFWAEWCGPCKILGPKLEQAAEDRGGAFVLAKVNVDEAQNVAAQFGIQSIPTVVSFKDGRPVNSFMGVVSEPELEKFLDELCPESAQAKPVTEFATPEEAEAHYKGVLAEDAKDVTAGLGLAKIHVDRKEMAEAKELLEAVSPEERADKNEADRLGAVIALSELVEDLGSEAEVRARHEAEPESHELRYELGCLLAADGRYPEALELLLSAAQRNKAFAREKVREAMVAVFNAVGQRDPLSDKFRDELAMVLF